MLWRDRCAHEVMPLAESVKRRAKRAALGAHSDVILRNNIQSSLAIPHQQPQFNSADFIPHTPAMASCDFRVDHSHSRVSTSIPDKLPPKQTRLPSLAHSRPTNTPSPRKPLGGVATGLPKMSGKSSVQGAGYRQDSLLRCSLVDLLGTVAVRGELDMAHDGE